MRTLIIVLTLVAALAAWAAPSAEARVTAILATITAGDFATSDAAEDALVKLGAPALPAVQAALAERRKAQSDVEKTGDWAKILGAQQTISALDGAVVRLTWGCDPRAIITGYLRGLKFPDGRAFTREGRPERVMDDVVARAVPGYVWYFVAYPGYHGGAAPTSEILRRYEVPDPLRAQNLFAMAKNGKTTLMTDRGMLEKFFIAHAAPAKTEASMRDAVAAWLLLAERYAWTFMGPYRFTAPEGLSVQVGNATDFARGEAKVLPSPLQSGALTATLSFDLNGRITAIETVDTLQDTTPPPPAAMPGGGGPKPLAIE
jgi:hypothetical protein